MRRHISTLLLTLCVALAGAAQTPSDHASERPNVFDSVAKALAENWKIPNLECQNEIRIGLPLDLSEAFDGEGIFLSTYPSAYGDYLASQRVLGTPYYYSAPSICYGHRLNRSLELTAKTAYVGFSQRSYSLLSGDVLQSQDLRKLFLTPGLRWNFLLGRRARYYIGMGCDVVFQRENAKSFCTVEACYEIGFTLGSKIFVYGETQFSNSRIMSQMGVGYRF